MKLIQITEYMDCEAIQPFHDGLPVVYLLCNEQNEIVYIGKTSHLAKRITQHRKDKDFAMIHYFRLDGCDIDRIEKFLISLARPKYNKRILVDYGTFIDYTNGVTLVKEESLKQ